MPATLLFIPAVLTPLTTAAIEGQDNIEEKNLEAQNSEVKKSAEAPGKLEEITVRAGAETVSTNSSINKDTNLLNKQQVNNIRDLARFDAGIFAVEQNRGGTSGFSIRGVDKNRVAVNVDGLPQLQSYHATTSYVLRPKIGSGARNEIELENIAEVELNKGGSSVRGGNGALGGSVNFRTKHVHDVLSEGEKFALTSKTAYSSKDSQVMQSVGTAFDTGKVRGLFQYTYRNGKETKVHSNILKKKYQVQTIGAFVDKYKLLTNTPNELNSENSLFYKCETCKEGFYTAKLSRFHTLESALKYYREDNPNRQFTPEEMEQLKQMVYPTQTLSAKDYTGENREAPDPKRQTSHSYLSRLEFQLTPNQSIGAIVEDTKQMFVTRDMSLEAYYAAAPQKPNFAKPKEPPKPSGPNYNDYCMGEKCDEKRYYQDFQEYLKKLYEYRRQLHQLEKNNKEYAAWKNYERKIADYHKHYLKNRREDGVIRSAGYYLKNIMEGAYAPGLYTRARFNTEIHHKKRQSLNYVFDAKNKWMDRFELNFDLQKISIHSDSRELACSLYPKVDKNCRASKSKPGSYETLTIVDYKETHKHLGFKFDKDFDLGNIQYHLNLIGGGSHYGASQDSYAASIAFSGLEAKYRKGKDGRNEIYVVPPPPHSKPHSHNNAHCNQPRKGNSQEYLACGFKIKGQNRYLGIHNQIAFGEYAELGLGFRRDRDSVAGNTDFLAHRVYKNSSYLLSTAVKPIEGVRVGYSYSTGFRNPSFQEIVGWTPGGNFSSLQLKPETSVNHEIGFTLSGRWGYVEANKFISKYKGLITIAYNLRDPNPKGYNNASNASIEGYGLRSWFDLHEIIPSVPSGFSTSLAYERTKPKKAEKTNNNFMGYEILYPFDAIQPARFVVGLNYDAPSEKWGTSLLMTHSRAKDIRELLNSNEVGKNTGTYDLYTDLKTSPWTTFDLLGYYQIRKHITLNLGINNLLNKQYSTWESVRRSARTSPHQEKLLSVARYAAPGRNYFVSLNIKF
ncbi:TonB-dependent hemoglobin/transferrin/lactoferrin family receptor [Mesocricetibacter intestinalis]|nr:TonB-dependent hemoglobin/transferrin/lactoferrin family receptor [Mesocricetibacter intestinalis]